MGIIVPIFSKPRVVEFSWTYSGQCDRTGKCVVEAWNVNVVIPVVWHTAHHVHKQMTPMNFLAQIRCSRLRSHSCRFDNPFEKNDNFKVGEEQVIRRIIVERTLLVDLVWDNYRGEEKDSLFILTLQIAIHGQRLPKATDVFSLLCDIRANEKNANVWLDELPFS